MAEHVEAYPLAWPEGWERTPAQKRRNAPFQVSLAIARDQLLEEIRRVGGRNPIISTNVAVYERGGRYIPYANQPNPEDPGVAVYWTTREGEQRVIACDRWQTVRENIRAIGLTINALRGLDRWGSSTMLDRAFRGFAALPPAERHWTEILGVTRGWKLEDIETRYRALAREIHPDRAGGDADRMADLNRAIAEARREKNGRQLE